MNLQAKRKGMSRYHFGTVSDYLEVHNADISVILSLISKDVVGYQTHIRNGEVEIYRLIELS